jgi:hypothetical protein
MSTNQHRSAENAALTRVRSVGCLVGWLVGWLGMAQGMAMFEQDFICQTQLATSANLTLGRDWFRALDAAVLAAGGVDLQLCMMQPAHALASTTMRSVTNARATQDHVSPFSLSVSRARSFSFSFSFSLSVCARVYGLTYTWMYCAVPCCCALFLCRRTGLLSTACPSAGHRSSCTRLGSGHHATTSGLTPALMRAGRWTSF